MMGIAPYLLSQQGEAQLGHVEEQLQHGVRVAVFV